MKQTEQYNELSVSHQRQFHSDEHCFHMDNYRNQCKRHETRMHQYRMFTEKQRTYYCYDIEIHQN